MGIADRHAHGRAGALPPELGPGHLIVPAPIGGTLLAPADVIRLEDDAVVLLDQTRLPGERVDRRCATWPSCARRSASSPSAARPRSGSPPRWAWRWPPAARARPTSPALRAELADARAQLAALAADGGQPRLGARRAATTSSRRPTATPDELRAALAALARRIHDDEVARCRAMGAPRRRLLAAGRARAHALQRGRARDRRLRHGARRRARGARARPAAARLGGRDAAAAAGRAADRVGAGARTASRTR